MTTELYHNICDYLSQLIQGTEWEGHIYAVGGCCRDEIMGLPIKDLDIAVNLPDGGVRFALWLYQSGYLNSTPTLFRQYGTAKLNLLKFPDDEIELVQTRKEKYTDHNSRNPETAFGSMAEDCHRRDLTINSLYYNITEHTYIDLTGYGIDDIRKHVIRTPDNPDTTYDDDPVRILRCIRFASRFGWDIRPDVYKAMVRNVHRLRIVSVERIRGEFEKMLTCDDPIRALKLLRSTDAMRYIIPELCKTYTLEQNKYHVGTVWEHTLQVVAGVRDDYLLRLAALLHDIGKINTRSVDEKGVIHFFGHERSRRMIVKLLQRLHYHKDFIRKVIFLVENHMATKRWGRMPDTGHDKYIRRLQYKCQTPQRFDNLMQLIDSDNKAMSPEHCLPDQIETVKKASDRLVAEGSDMFNFNLPTTVDCLVENYGMSPSQAEQQINNFINRYSTHPFITGDDFFKNLSKSVVQKGGKDKNSDATKRRRRNKRRQHRRKE